MKLTRNEMVTLHTLVGNRIGMMELSGACEDGAPAQQSNINYRAELIALRAKLANEIDKERSA